MTAYKTSKKSGKRMQPWKGLKPYREEMGYSMQDMADELAISKATYQGYDNGSRRTPYKVLRAVATARRIDRQFFQKLPASIDRHSRKQFPFGIPSAIKKNDHEDFS